MSEEHLSATEHTHAVQSIPVFAAAALVVVNGANLHDPVTISDELTDGDIYMLDPDAQRTRLSLQTDDDGMLSVTDETECGTPGALIYADCTMTLMSPDGLTTEALVLVELDTEGHIAETFLLPLARMQPKTEYSLVGFDTETAREKLAQVACVSFARGTHITLSTG